MAISFVGTTGFVSGTGALSVAVSTTGAQSGDLLLCFVNTAFQAGASAPQLDGNSFTLLFGTTPGTGTSGAAGGVDVQVSYLWFTSGTTLSYGDVGSYQTMVVVALRGVNTVTPFSGAANRVDASATTTVTTAIDLTTGRPSSTQWLVHAIGLDRDTTANPYTALSGLNFTGSYAATNFVTGSSAAVDMIYGATTNAGAGGGLWVTRWSGSGGVTTPAPTFTDSTTHAYISFYINARVDATFSATTSGNATAAGNEGSLVWTTYPATLTNQTSLGSVSTGTVYINWLDAVAGDFVVGAMAIKPYSTTAAVPNYFALASVADGTEAAGVGTGSTRVATFGAYPTSSKTGNETASITGSPYLVMPSTTLWTKDSTCEWQNTYTTGSDTSSSGTTISATGIDTIPLQKDDYLWVFATYTAATLTHNSLVVSVPGITFDTWTWGNFGSTSTNHIGAYRGYAKVLSGTATGPPTYSATASITDKSSVPVFFLRVRTVLGSTASNGTFSATTSGNATAAGNEGALTASGGSSNATFDATTTGSATAEGNSGAFSVPATFVATTNADATAVGNTGALTGTAGATFAATTNGDATASTSGTLSLTGTATFAANTNGDASASGEQGALTGAATFDATTQGTASSAGNEGAFVGTATFVATTSGTATGTGNEGSLTGTATFASTTTGNADAAGNEGSMYEASANGTFASTTAGNATAEGVEGTLIGTATFTSETGASSAQGEAGALTGGATLTTELGTATGSGADGALTGDGVFTGETGTASGSGASGALTADVSLTTEVGTANAAGEQGSFTATGDVTLTLVVGEATASGEAGAFTGTASATFESVTGDAQGQGGTGSLTSDVSVLTDTGTATAEGVEGSFTGAATFTTLGDSSNAYGGSVTLTGDATFTTEVAFATAEGAEGSFAVSFVTVAADAAGAGNDLTYTGDANWTFVVGTSSAAGNEGSMTGTGADISFGTNTGTAYADGRGVTFSSTSTITDEAAANGTSASGTGWANTANAIGVADESDATWTSSTDGATSSPLVVGGFGTWAAIPDGATINLVTVKVHHHESHAGTPLESVTLQAFLGAVGLGTPTSIPLTLAHVEDSITPTLTLAELRGNTLEAHLVADRV